MPEPQPRTDHRFGLDGERRNGLVFVAAMVALMWVSEIVDAILGGDLDRYGIVPRDTEGLDGVVFSPFLHGGFDHLISNTVPFVLLGGVIALSGLARVGLATAIIMVVGGLGTWLVAPANTVHIGASGVVFGYAAYLISRAVYTRSFSHLGVGLVVVAIWGATLLGGLVPQDGISWQGHLFGAVGGVVAAWALDGRARRARRSEGAGALRV